MFDNLKPKDWFVMIAGVTAILGLSYAIMYGTIVLIVNSIVG